MFRIFVTSIIYMYIYQYILIVMKLLEKLSIYRWEFSTIAIFSYKEYFLA